MTHIIGLDLGTTTVTGVVWAATENEVVRLAQRPNDAALKPSHPTRAEQDPERLGTLALAVLADLAAGGEPMAGLALTSQMHGLLCIDGEGRPLTPLISWQDHRTDEPLPVGATTLDRLRTRIADLDWHRNGCRIQHGYGAATWFWLVQQGKLPAGTARLCTLAGWLAGQFTGQLPVTDPTFAASWGVYDLVEGGWNAAFLERLGLDPGLLPPVRPSGAQIGGLSPQVATKTGLPAGLPVFNPLGDTQASFLGSVADAEREVMVGLGTGGRVAWMVPAFEPSTAGDGPVETRPLPKPGHPDVRPLGRHVEGNHPELVEGRFLRVGASLCGGAAYAWLNRTVRAWLAGFGLELDEERVYERLNTLAREREDPAGLRVRTTFLGVRGDPAVGAGAIEGITLETMELGALARATLLGMVDELYAYYAAHGGEEAGHTQIIATGGAVRRNPLLPGLIGERFGLPVQVAAHEEAGAVGAARLVD